MHSLGWSSPVWGIRTHWRPEIEVVSYFFDRLGLNRELVFNERIHKGMVAKKVDDTRNPQRIDVNRLNRLWTKNWFPGCTRDPQTLRDVLLGLLLRKRGSAAAKHNTLTELAKLWELEFLLQFSLPGENDQQKLFRGSLQIRQKANLFQHGIR